MKVHFMRAAHRAAEKVCSSANEQKLFNNLASLIPNESKEENVNTLFHSLKGEVLPCDLPNKVLPQYGDFVEYIMCYWQVEQAHWRQSCFVFHRRHISHPLRRDTSRSIGLMVQIQYCRLAGSRDNLWKGSKLYCRNGTPPLPPEIKE